MKVSSENWGNKYFSNSEQFVVTFQEIHSVEWIFTVSMAFAGAHASHQFRGGGLAGTDLLTSFRTLNHHGSTQGFTNSKSNCVAHNIAYLI